MYPIIFFDIIYSTTHNTMGLLTHVKYLVDKLYPYAANALGNGAIAAAKALQNIGVSDSVAKTVLDVAIKSIPTTKTISKVAEFGVDMYKERQRENDPEIGYYPSSTNGGLGKRIQYPGNEVRGRYSTLNAPYVRIGAGGYVRDDAFPTIPSMDPRIVDDGEEIEYKNYAKKAKKNAPKPMKKVDKAKKLPKKPVKKAKKQRMVPIM